jgi:hypothetical protein
MVQGIVIRGTTPTHEFELPYPIALVDDIRVVYGQNKKAIIVKTINDCTLTEGQISISLTQEETFLFSASKKVEIELRIKLANGKVVRTEEPIILRVIGSMSDEVID